MDAITVRLPCCLDDVETYTMMTADFDMETSASGIASKVGTISYVVTLEFTLQTSRYR